MAAVIRRCYNNAATIICPQGLQLNPERLRANNGSQCITGGYG